MRGSCVESPCRRLEDHDEVLDEAVAMAKFINYREAVAKEFRNLLNRPGRRGPRRFVSLPISTRWYSQVECASH
jgi:hypothetical protein